MGKERPQCWRKIAMLYDMPPGSIDSLDIAGDWIETSALFGKDEQISKLDVVGIYSEYLTSDDEKEDEDQETSELYVDYLWARLCQRSSEIASGYPFSVGRDAISRKRSWEESPAYSLLLANDICRRYSKIQYTEKYNLDFPRAFEDIVASSEKGLFKGKTFRFGWPTDEMTETDVNNRIKQMTEMFGITPFEGRAKAKPKDKDLGLDVVSRFRISEELSATAYLLTQCATGNNWRKKTGEPSILKWNKLVDWNATQIRVVALPFRHGNDDNRDNELFQTWVDFDDIIVLDRPRLARGCPDTNFEVGIDLERIRNLTRTLIEQLPSL